MAEPTRNKVRPQPFGTNSTVRLIIPRLSVNRLRDWGSSGLSTWLPTDGRAISKSSVPNADRFGVRSLGRSRHEIQERSCGLLANSIASRSSAKGQPQLHVDIICVEANRSVSSSGHDTAVVTTAGRGIGITSRLTRSRFGCAGKLAASWNLPRVILARIDYVCPECRVRTSPMGIGTSAHAGSHPNATRMSSDAVASDPKCHRRSTIH